jgi:nicotinamidase-related amidase
MDALIVVDMQAGCFDGEPPRLDREGTVRRINSLAAAVRQRGLVVFIQHTVAEQGYERGSVAWKLLPELSVQPGDQVVEKTACDSFLETDLDRVLCQAGVRRVMIVGCATDFCVDTTVRAAASRGYDVVVPSDGHTTRDRPHLRAQDVIAHHHYMWTDLLLPHGRRVRVIPCQTVIDELTEDSTTAQ